MKKIYLYLISAITLCNVANAQNPVVLQQHSVTPTLITMSMAGVNAYGLIGSDDNLSKAPNFKFGGMADGAGITLNHPAVMFDSVVFVKGTMATVTGMYNPEGTYLYLTNHEDNLGISRMYLDETFKPLKGDWILNSNAGYWRLCSATMAKPEINGFGPVFFSGGESGAESLVHAVDPFSKPAFKNVSPDDSVYWDQGGQYLHHWGRWSTENAVPLHKDAYPGKVVIILGDDDFEGQGQIVMIVGNLSDFKNKNYNNVTVYALRKVANFTTLTGADLDKARFERGLTGTAEIDVEFVEIPNIVTMTGAQINAFCNANNTMSFGRVEDIDFRKSMTNPGAASRETYICVTGQVWGSTQNPLSSSFDPVTFTGFWDGTSTSYGNNGYTGFNTVATIPGSHVFAMSGQKTMFGRVYKLLLDPTNHLKGKLSIVWDGDAKNSNAGDIKNYLMNCDNIMATEDYLYIQEDPNRYSGGGTSTSTQTGCSGCPINKFYFNYENHDSRIYQYNIATGAVSIFLEQDHRRTASDASYYNQAASGGGSFANPNPTGTTSSISRPGDWEYGALVDVSAETGKPGTYILSNQPHSWQSLNYIRPDGGSRPTPQGYRLEASNLIVLSGLPEKSGTSMFSMAAETPTWHWFDNTTATSPIYSGKHFVTTMPGNYWVAYGTSMAKSAKKEVNLVAVTVSSTNLQEAALTEASFNISPNPTSGDVNVSFENMFSSTVYINVTGANGNTVATATVEGKGTHKKVFSLGSKGIYTISLTSGNSVLSKKVVVE
ncbi:MAG: T9SS type A sorting domain-containing protein [Cytophagales bacterium]|nr:T9SS type A sorting domain-containing protein [Cytophagales bacterium]